MSVQSEIDRIRGKIAEAYSAVSDRGGVLPRRQDCGNLAEAIRSIGAGGAAGEPLDPVEVYKSTRPTDWLPLPEPADDEMYLLVHIPDGASALLAFTVTCTGRYTVQPGRVDDSGAFQGPATSTTTRDSGETCEMELFSDRYGSLTGDGMRQAVVKISGTDILTWEPSVHSGRTAPAGFSGWDIVEIKCRFPKGTAVLCGHSTKNRELRRLRFFSWDGPNAVTDMSSMFNNCSALCSVLNLDTGRVAEMGGMFGGCASLTAIPPLETAGVTDMNGMFSGCGALTAIPRMDTANVTNMNSLFKGCGALRSVPQLDVSNATDVAGMFNGCTALTAVPPLDTRKAAAMGTVFSGCSALVDVPLLQVAKATTVSSMFYNCFCLRRVRFDPSVTGWAGAALSLANCGLGHEALVEFLESLPTITAAKTLTLTGNPGTAELTEAEQAVAANKNWLLKL